MEYTIDFFIDKFKAIPEELWIVQNYSDGLGAHCALGHCGGDYGKVSIECSRLADIIGVLGVNVSSINDGNIRYNQRTPKQRILAALYDCKRIEEENGKPNPVPAPPIKEKIKYVSVSEKIKEDNKDLVLN